MTDDPTPPATTQTALMDGPSDDVVEAAQGTSNEPTSFAEAIEQVGAGSLLGYRLQQQAILSDFGLFALQCRDNDALLAKAAEMAADGMRTGLCKVLEYRPEPRDLLFRAGVGWKAGVIGNASLAADDKSPAGFAFQNGTPVISAMSLNGMLPISRSRKTRSGDASRSSSSKSAWTRVGWWCDSTPSVRPSRSWTTRTSLTSSMLGRAPTAGRTSSWSTFPARRSRSIATASGSLRTPGSTSSCKSAERCSMPISEASSIAT